ncbi:hypothetical protein ES702_05668 [subsurface metagenome]
MARAKIIDDIVDHTICIFYIVVTYIALIFGMALIFLICFAEAKSGRESRRTARERHEEEDEASEPAEWVYQKTMKVMDVGAKRVELRRAKIAGRKKVEDIESLKGIEMAEEAALAEKNEKADGSEYLIELEEGLDCEDK